MLTKLSDILERKTNSNILLSKFIFVLILWVIISISVVTMLAAISIPTVNDNVTERHNMGAISDNEYITWQTIVLPSIDLAFITMQGLVVCLILLSLAVIVHPFYKLKKSQI
jgi:hypothetical protein